MKDSLLLTKLYIPPSSPRVIQRPHLMARIDEGIESGCKLSLISAPVGYGKSTLVSSWLTTTKFPTAWLSLEPEDNDARQFWTYVIAAIQTIHPQLGQDVLDLLKTAQTPSIEGLLSDFINQIAVLSGKLILVLDDFHVLESTDLRQGFKFFLDHLPPQMHMVMITREDPPLLLPQMRAKGQMVEVRSNDLRFSIEECAQFLNQKMGLGLQTAEISTLGRRTEGWAAGLQMAALSLRELDDPAAFIDAFAGDNRYVADYLISEVLDRQPVHIREFLQQTAVVDRFTPALCDALIGDDASQSGGIIEQIEALGLFVVPLDHVRRWYRYHQLFADLLRYRLQQDDPSRFLALNRTASRWYQLQGFLEEAVKYALAGEDHEHVAELVEESGLTMVGSGRLTRLQIWIAALPEKTIREHPYLSVLLVWVGALTGRSDLARRQLALAAENLPAAKPDLHSEIVCQIALLRAYAARTSGDLDSSINHALEALRHLPEANVFLDCTIQLNLGGNYWLKGNFSALEKPLKHAIAFINNAEVEYPALAAAGFLANAYLQQGQLRQADDLCQRIHARYSQQVHPAAAYVYLEQGELFYERNDLDGALEALSRTIRIGENADKIVNLIRARQLLARTYQALGDQEEAADLMKEADELYSQTSPRYQVMHQIEYEYYRVLGLLSRQNIPAALKWAGEYEKRRGAIDIPWVSLNELIYARVLLADGRPDQAQAVLQACEESARSSGARRWVIQSLSLQSLCYQETADLDRALESLRGVLGLAEPEGYVRTFVDYGVPMQRLLRLAVERDVASDYVAELLAAFPEEERENALPGPQKTLARQPLVEPLTERELNILRLMAGGLSHNEIAGQLYLSVNTIKWHTTHIYSKLGVHRRAHAVARAQELDIL